MKKMFKRNKNLNIKENLYNKDEINKDEINIDEINKKNDIEKQILEKVRKDSEIIYKEIIKKDMIEYIRGNDYHNIEYKEWLRKFNVLDWEQEFNYVSVKRDNKVYHNMWDILTDKDGYILIH